MRVSLNIHFPFKTVVAKVETVIIFYQDKEDIIMKLKY